MSNFRIHCRLVCALLGIVSPPLLSAQGVSDHPCSSPAHRQFDFWVGEWRVTDQAGQEVGTSVIAPTLDGCAITEAWTSPRSRGYSINFYDGARKQWHQTWIDNAGQPLYLDGSLRDGAMVLEGHRPGQGGGTALHRITWRRMDNGRVEQLWETSSHGGQNWSVLFRGTYARQGPG